MTNNFTTTNIRVRRKSPRIYDYDVPAYTSPVATTYTTINSTFTIINKDISHLPNTTSTTLQTSSHTPMTFITRNYYGKRYYSTDLGRWISRDPQNERKSPVSSLNKASEFYNYLNSSKFIQIIADSLNHHLFVRNNSINSYDYLGLKDMSDCTITDVKVWYLWGGLGGPVCTPIACLPNPVGGCTLCVSSCVYSFAYYKHTTTSYVCTEEVPCEDDCSDEGEICLNFTFPVKTIIEDTGKRKNLKTIEVRRSCPGDSGPLF